MPARVFADYMKVATQNFPESVFDYPEVSGGSSTYLKIDDVDETVDEAEEKAADKKAQENRMNLVVPDVVNENQNKIEQVKPTKPQKQFNVDAGELVTYPDEEFESSGVPLPGM